MKTHKISVKNNKINPNDINIICVKGTLYKNIKYLSKLLTGVESNNLENICENTYFQKNYDCINISVNETKKLLQKTKNIPIDRTYCAIDKNINKIIGFMQFTIIPYMLDDNGKQIIELSFAGTKSYGNPYYKGTGTILLNYALNDYIKNDGINTFVIFGWSEYGIGLYYKMGFKHYGNTMTLVKRVDNTILHPNILRQIEFNVLVKYKNSLHKSLYKNSNKNKLKFKLPYGYKLENDEQWTSVYGNCDYHNKNGLTNCMFATPKMITEITKFHKKYYYNNYKQMYYIGRSFI